jgi:hypothetical protein
MLVNILGILFPSVVTSPVDKGTTTCRTCCLLPSSHQYRSVYDKKATRMPHTVSSAGSNRQFQDKATGSLLLIAASTNNRWQRHVTDVEQSGKHFSPFSLLPFRQLSPTRIISFTAYCSTFVYGQHLYNQSL